MVPNVDDDDNQSPDQSSITKDHSFASMDINEQLHLLLQEKHDVRTFSLHFQYLFIHDI